MKSNAHLRIRVISACVVLIVLVLIAKLYYLQIVLGDDFRLKAEHQYVRPNENVFSRGSIFFQNKDGTLFGAAVLKTGFTLSVNPRLIKNPEETYAKINAILPIDRGDFLTKAGKSNDPYEEIAKRVDDATGRKIDALKLPGVSVYQDRWRFYPGQELAANVLGFVGYQGNVLNGRYGIENYYDDTLHRQDNDLYTNFFAEIFSNIEKTVAQKTKLEGDVVTSIEPTVEGTLEKELASVEDQWHSDLSGGIIMNPKTGEIYAMATSPSFNPNSFQTEKNQAIFPNPSVEHVYEMGSIIKPLTMAAGIDSGTVTPETTYDDKGFLMLNNAKISNFDGKGRGVVTMQTVLNESLNTGAAFVALKMGNDLFSTYFRNFGLGEETGIDLPNETAGLIDNLKSPRSLEHATASFGQGIAMSPISTIRALAALANGGYLVTPHVAERIDYRIGVSKNISYDPGRRVIGPATAETVTTMLVKVVDQALLGGTVKLPRYSVAAKTGTAQIAKETGGGYYADRYLHSFFGYFPAYNPQFIVFLYTIYPKNATYASHTLTAPFISLTKFLVNYYHVPPDR